ncbi:ABC transporter ATP-binding protein [Taibaiella sp. KBW10]|uniref:peptidase domain-containing ABC transporter n=1 Tax=Taibaiella sp. KBW10 TaxID=2153357 RepID=UPI000F59E0B2|nr:peptidase domain-containing ABC transporter [Taibaiella sp. KBW10]RQO31967.1 ABC transporter ATP-binding protein [Taibaiella sp. KBW10]
MRYAFYKQLDMMDCGATCLRIVAKQYGKEYSIVKLRRICETTKQGVSMQSITNAAKQIGFSTLGVKVSLQELKQAPLPCILHWENSHFVVLHKIATKQSGHKTTYTIANPASEGLMNIDEDTFKELWQGEYSDKGVAILLEKEENFDAIHQEADTSDTQNRKVNWHMLWAYLMQHKGYFIQVIFGLLVASLFQLLIPFLTEAIVDKGVHLKDVNFVYLILIAQLMLLLARTLIDFSRQALLLYISTAVNLSLLTDFWKKLMHLPIAYFDTKQTGDIIQRIGDQHRIERFLTGGSVNILFSIINLIVYSVVMLLYSIPVFIIFAIGSILYLLWVSLFLKKRRQLNYMQFAVAAKENSATLELVHGMQEIKMHNAEKHFRTSWEELQRSLFTISFKNLSLSQVQQVGALFINEGKNLLVTGLVAAAVIKGELTLGAMLAIQYILGALNNPIQQFTGFIQEFQDAKISLERLNEIHEEKAEPLLTDRTDVAHPKQHLSISVHNLAFGYLSGEENRVLNNIDLEIPAGKVTAIVGMSGSGKTTLLKILQQFYDHSYTGSITVREETAMQTTSGPEATELRSIVPAYWRQQVGSVMQDGHIFNLPIRDNIALGMDKVDMQQLEYAVHIANLKSFIDNLPLGYDTKIGMEGNGISQGQKQRILIARAVYKNPEILLFDEATNALDANNEKVILENLESFFKGKTVVVVAHRLSTVKNADKIVVLEKGRIVEEGNHEVLTALKGKYYQLVKNQLELGT